MQGQRAELEWRDGGVPVSMRFDDPYFSLDDGLAETEHVFLAGNELPQRFRPGFHVAELGFGTGLNLLATWKAWEENGTEGALRFTSFEAFPMTREDMAHALKAFPALSPFAMRFLEVWHPDGGVFDLGSLVLEVIVGDARTCLPDWVGRADAWYLDGFSPAKNPELWEDSLMVEIARHTGPGGTVATYTAAGFVRRGLEAAGFAMERRSGFGRKRHMSVGRLA
ncbi:tRNA (5-methylaminomethyl-2-thiouridine)(34)-methyltransferase MnmD [Aestuariivita sp.]|jgi:tRNA U34 5-methylaminomethyl-2-thiouridine-forming methyltransferase MnmC|uniref:tRNA (5-methylaminomethyl-2-thiouridine)(34)-methyltransferase MnmD n=1 Tax=Aestuariivita sp. TaxID=1872407 RepID=UPI002172B23C|nr:tRNA (5-methylaminomethyl-2-thiouridine)(34)-methyltransferase MnmD [Aestuariivita sp.]MCE8007333.1 tRNA (5-methylaminomethyl-2-thiouridine)(34)-methyltransferase MnmD [Aestuariivita sp.]